MRDEEPALRQRSGVVRPHDQILAALPAVGPRRAEVDHPAEPGVLHSAEKLGRSLQHHWSLAEIEGAHHVDRVGIRGQEQRLGIHQLFENDDLVVLDANAFQTLAEALDADATQIVHERAVGVGEVEVVVEFLAQSLCSVRRP